MTQRKRLEGTAASWHPHPKEPTAPSPPIEPAGPDLPASVTSLAPVVRPAEAIEPPLPVATSDDETFDELYAMESPAVAARRRALESAPAQARRRYLLRYVASAVGVASVIGLAALVRVALAPARAADPSTLETGAAAMAMAVPAPIAVPDAPPEPTAVASSNPIPSAEAPSANVPAGESESETERAPTPDLDAVAAREAKQEAQHAIEHGQLPEAIGAAERSIALDPTDAEAWLILGAAYQSSGRYTKARRAFSSCKKEATRGPRSECVALLR